MRTVLIAAAFVVAAACTTTYAQNDWGNIGRYAEANHQLATQADNGKRVVLIGNSITDGWPGTHPEFFETNGLIGRGISGQTSYQFLVRFRDDVVNLHPAIVVINVATNDIAENNYPYDQTRTLGNIMTMVEVAQANGIKPILTSVLPTNSFPWRPEISDAATKVQQLNKAIRQYADSKGIPYVDYHATMADPATGAMKDGLSGDGVHPNADGYTLMEAALLPVIKKCLK